MITVLPPTRNRDKHGAGYYGASRGKRTHVGVDFKLEPEADVCAFRRGTVTKLGYAYGDDLSFRYIEIKDNRDFYSRYFYVEPCVSVGDEIDLGACIGHSQSLLQRYPGITPHLHYEVFRSEGGGKAYVNPYAYLAGDV
jgi:murein DD-endopeptidase MepM/ murein hydrolase activator NlpD